MAVRLWRRRLSPPSEPTILLRRCSAAAFPGWSGTRWGSSSSSSSSSPGSPDGTPSKPQKKTTDRLSAVIDAVNDRKLPPELRGQRNNVRSETDIVNVVEHRIWHSMEEGQFDNLPGKGKPLNLDVNPHADPAEDTLYRILSKNGCAPEWVELNKEIRNKIPQWRAALKRAWNSKDTGSDSQWTERTEALKGQMRDINDKWRAALKRAWNSKDTGSDSQWTERTEALKGQMRDINDKVFKYNLIVPFGRQMCGLKWEKEIDRLKEESESGEVLEA